MRIRGASGRDIHAIDKLFKESNFKLDLNHLELLIVAENEDGDIVGAGSLVTLIEATFVMDKTFRVRERVEAMKGIIQAGTDFTKSLKYDIMHGFVQDPAVVKSLKKHFDFQDPVGQVLIKFV